MTQSRAGSTEDQQRAVLKTAECAYGSMNPIEAEIMKRQGMDPKEMIDQFKRLENDMRR